jgi:hypothetical protein
MHMKAWSLKDYTSLRQGNSQYTPSIPPNNFIFFKRFPYTLCLERFVEGHKCYSMH